MRYSETSQLFEQAFEFPVEKETVEEQLGEIELTAPTGEAVTVEGVLDRTSETTFESAPGLYNALVGNLEDGFIGRKYYDDRSSTDTESAGPRGEDVSL